MSPSSATCLECFCGCAYNNAEDLEEHRRAKGHFTSHVCSNRCVHPMAAQEIIQPWQCSTCGKLCERFEILRDHHLARGHCFCTVCGLHFDTHTAFEDHQAGLHASEFKCCDCNITFSDVGTLKGHIASCAHQKPVENRYACTYYKNTFRTPGAFARHMELRNPVENTTCENCGISFSSLNAILEHLKSKHKSASDSASSPQVSIQQDEENTCKDCEKKFSNWEALLQHRQSVKHKPLRDLKCPLGKGCSGRFTSPSALLQHLKSKHNSASYSASSHQVSIQQDEENTCKDCEKTFSNREALLQHRQSVKHKPLSDLKCPLGKGCSGRFMTPSALLQHLESGNCHSGMDRHEIFRMVQSCDADHVIHSPSHLHTRNSFRSPDIETPAFPSGGGIPTNYSDAEIRGSSVPTPQLDVSVDGSSSSWSLIPTPQSGVTKDGSLSPWSLLETSSMDVDHTGGLQALTELKCSLCPPKRKPFAKAKDLEQHLNSAAHCAKIYHCPSSIFSATNVQKQHVKERQFSTLSGLTQHMENGACNGDKKAFVSSIGIIQRQLKLMGFEGIPLLLPSSRS